VDDNDVYLLVSHPQSLNNKELAKSDQLTMEGNIASAAADDDDDEEVDIHKEWRQTSNHL
jgi:hypothetical protein